MIPFKILKGDSSRIDMSITPFHDGYVYFTPDDCGVYIDSEDNGVQRRIRINQPSNDSANIVSVDVVLLASEWSSGKQTLSVNDITDESDGIICVSHNTSYEEIDAIRKAGLYVFSQNNGSVTVAISGEVPTCDIHAVIMIIDSKNDKVINATLLASGWIDAGAYYKQTIAVDGLLSKDNGIINISEYASDDERMVAQEAVISVINQSDGAITVVSDGIVPQIDIPVSISIIN